MSFRLVNARLTNAVLLQISHVSYGLYDFRDEGCLGCRTFEMWDVWGLGCSTYGMFRMWDVWDVGCSWCGMFGMWYVWDVVCSACGIFGMWDVWDVGCSGCGIFGMLDVQDVAWLGCGICGMWDVYDVGCSGCGMLEMWTSVKLAMHGPCMASHTWLIHEFYYLMCFLNFILKLCLYCRKTFRFCCFFVFDPVIRSSLRRCSVRKGVLRNFAKFTGKHLCH